MAYINVAEWSPDQVTDWLKGMIAVFFFFLHQSFYSLVIYDTSAMVI